MASEQVRLASKALGPLLRRRGTSPALGAALRKALAALDKSLTGLDGQKQEETIQAGILELRSCVELITASDQPADHEQLAGIKAALAVLAPEAMAAESTTDRSRASSIELCSAQSAPGAREDAKPGVKRRRRTGTAPILESHTVDVHLQGLLARLQILHAARTDPLFCLGDILPIQAEVDKQVRSLKWLGPERVSEVLRVIDATSDSEAKLVAGAALAQLGAERGIEWLFAILDKLAPPGSGSFPPSPRRSCRR